MLAAGGLLILMAVGFGLGALLIDGSDDMTADSDGLGEGTEPDTGAATPDNTLSLGDGLFDAEDDDPLTDEEATGLGTLTDGPVADSGIGFWGDDLGDGGTSDDVLRARSEMQAVLGGVGDDAVTGGPDADSIEGGAETDAIFGNEGDDLLSGLGGADEIYGDDGNDTLLGGSGTDFLVGGDGHDSLYGGSEGDMMFGEDGDDILAGGDGDDYLQGGFGADTLMGGGGHDRLDGTFTSGASIFATQDEDQADLLDGGDGDDTILLGAGDVAIGGAGHDTFVSGGFIEHTSVAGHITDFDPTQDVIELLYNPDMTPDPIVSVVDFADGTGAEILFNGAVILTVSGAQGLDPSAIELRLVQTDPISEPA